MTVLISPGYAGSIGDNANNPHILWDNLAASGTWTTSIGTEVESAALIATGTTFDPWIATPSSGSAAARLALSSAQDFTFVAIAAHNLGTIGASVRIQYSTDGGTTWLDSGAGIANPTDNRAIAWLFTEAPSTADWRIRINGAGSNDVEIGCAFFGDPLIIPQRIYQGYAPPLSPNVVDLQSNVSEGNHLLGSAEIRQGSRAQASLTDISPTYLRSDAWLNFQRFFNAGGGFFWAWRPTSYPDVYYAWRNGDTIAPSNSGPQVFQSFSMDMRFHHDP